MEEKIKVLVVDDAAFMRKAVVDILASDPMIEVVGTAENGLIGLEKARFLKPDVITLDMDMPVMNGIDAIRHIMIKCQIPIVVLSSLFADGTITFEALRLGVVDFVPKPSGAVSRDIDTARQKIIDRVKLAAAVKVKNIHRSRLPRWDARNGNQNHCGLNPLDSIVTVGTNLCGPNTVINLMANLTTSLPAAVVVLQEIAPKILPAFVEQFNRHVPWKIKALQEDTVIESGACYIGSTETSLSVAMNPEGMPHVMVGEAVDKPIDLLFASAAEFFHRHVVGVLLDGIGEDGAGGLAVIKRQSGHTVVIDTQCCVFPNLPENAIQCGVADEVVSEKELPAAIQFAIK